MVVQAERLLQEPNPGSEEEGASCSQVWRAQQGLALLKHKCLQVKLRLTHIKPLLIPYQQSLKSQEILPVLDQLCLLVTMSMFASLACGRPLAS